jgi:hypothetical protein
MWVAGYAEHCAERWRQAQQAIYADDLMVLWFARRAARRRWLKTRQRRRRTDPIYRPRTATFAEAFGQR